MEHARITHQPLDYLSQFSYVKSLLKLGTLALRDQVAMLPIL